MSKMMQNDMRFTLRPAKERGMADFGWLKSAHSFSFGNYHDPAHMGFGNLRAINEDRVSGGGGFPAHPHRNAEIFSYVTHGALEHRDSLGNGSIVSAGGVQFMSAGRGVMHSEFNPSSDEEMRFLQIWLLPEVRQTAPYYETCEIAPKDKDGRLALFLSMDGRDGSMTTHADANVYAACLRDGQAIRTSLTQGRKGWVQVVKGALSVNGLELSAGDGLAMQGQGEVILDQGRGAEILFFDLASMEARYG